MTFDLSPDQQAVRERARTEAEHIRAHGADIDRTSTVPPEVAQVAADSIPQTKDTVAFVIALEELAVASGAVALTAAGGQASAARHDLPGLRGAPALQDSPRNQLALASVALGLGRAACDVALAELRDAMANPGKGDEKPHWVIADVATELEAARMLTLAAAQALDASDAQTAIALARLMACAACRNAVDAALRVAGPAGYREGTLLERLSRDARAVSLLLGTEEHQRGLAAQGLFPG
jgi:alkylation response protein AidB-like acyl-CoA dehydrogenase